MIFPKVPNALASILSFAVSSKLKQLECTALAFTYTHIIQWNSKNCGEKGWYRIIERSGFLSAFDKPTSIHGWKYQFVFVKKEHEDWTIPIWNKRGPNRTWNKPRTTPNEREMATIYYFRVVDFIHPRSKKLIKVPINWLPPRVLFDYECSLCETGLCSAMPPCNLIAAPIFTFALLTSAYLLCFTL